MAYDLQSREIQLHIAEQQIAEAKQEEAPSHSLNNLVVNTIDAVIVTNRQGEIVEVNEQTCNLYGFNRESLIGTNINLLDADPSKMMFASICELALRNECNHYEVRQYNKAGEQIVIEINARAVTTTDNVYMQLIVRDITEKKIMQEQISQSKRMEALGMLAAGLAHDFDNALSTVFAFIDVMIAKTDPDEELLQQAKIVETTTKNATSLVANLLNLGKQPSQEKDWIDLNETIKNVMTVLKTVANKEGKRTEEHYDADVGKLFCNAYQIEQIILNLVINAIDATSSGGMISVTTMYGEIDLNSGKIHPMLLPGQYVVISVVDTGDGIPEDIREKMFDPFFTTKPDGNGIGLTMVYSVVKEYNGVITVGSQPGLGTTIDIYLPKNRQQTEINIAAIQNDAILLVDDDVALLGVMKRHIESAGYTIIATDSSLAAKNVVLNNENIKLVITDILMPLITGDDLIMIINKKKKDMKIIAITGIESQDICETTMKYADVILYKPIEPSQLLKAIQELLAVSSTR